MSFSSVTLRDLPDPLPDGVVLLDVREPVEWAHGHAEGAIHIPLSAMPVRWQEVADAERVYVVCKVGGRSAQAAMLLDSQGIDAVNVDGGMLAWESSGRPLVSETGGEAQVV